MTGTRQSTSTTDPTTVDNRLAAACEAAQRLHATLEDLIQHRGPRFDTMGRTATTVDASPPWNAQAAYLIFDLAQLVRGLEANLHLLISGAVSQRGGSTANTQLALRALPGLALAVDAEVTRLVADRVNSWCTAARVAVGEIEPLSLLPRLPRQTEPRCPWCERQSLRIQVQAGLVRCVNPICVDEDGNRPIARADIVDGVPVLSWGNDITSTYRGF